MSKIQKKSEPAPVVPEKKKLTPIKKADVQAEAKAEEKAPVGTTEKLEVPKAEEPKRPEMPDNFCMEKTDWDGNGVCYDPSSNNCKTCQTDFPETVAICIARTEFIGKLAGAGKVAKAKGPKKERAPKNGKKSQCTIIDDLLKATTPFADMVLAIAKESYGGESDSAKKLAEGRINRHLKSIRVGEYVRSAAMKEFIAYLATTAPTAEAPKSSAPAATPKK